MSSKTMFAGVSSSPVFLFFFFLIVALRYITLDAHMTMAHFLSLSLASFSQRLFGGAFGLFTVVEHFGICRSATSGANLRPQ